jgi:hypothetical protein
MNVVRLSKGDGKLPAWSAAQPDEDVSDFVEGDAGAALKGQPDARRKYFANAEHRKAIELGPDVSVSAARPRRD